MDRWAMLPMLGDDLRQGFQKRGSSWKSAPRTRFGPSRLIEQGQDPNPVQNHESKIKIGNEQ